MAMVYVREQGAMVRKRGGRLVVEKDHAALREIRLRETESVVLMGSVQISTQALAELLDRGIPVALLTRNGRWKGQVTPGLSPQVAVRVAQYRAVDDEAARVGVARALVVAKLAQSAELLEQERANYPSEELGTAVDSLRAAAARAAQCAAVPELMGVEGAGAAAYFGCFPVVNHTEFAWPGRVKHPATDPVNALLSLGYTLAMGELLAMAQAAGLDPYLGFLHEAKDGRASLALDLLEPFRAPLADRLALTLLNRRQLGPEDFARKVDGGGVVLMPEALKEYLVAFEAAMWEKRKAAPDGLRAAMRAQVESLRGALLGRGVFVPFGGDGCIG